MLKLKIKQTRPGWTAPSLLAIACALWLAVAGCGGGGGGSSSGGNPVSTNNVTSAGATINPTPAVTMVFPPNAVSTTTAITVQAVQPSVAAPAGQGIAPGTTFDFGPTGTVFEVPVQITVSYDPAQLPPGTQQSTLQLYTVVNGAWSQSGISSVSVNTTNHTISANISHFSTFGVLGTVIAPDTVSGQVSTSSGPVGAGYTVEFDGSTTLSAATNSSGGYTLAVPVSDITGSDTITVLDTTSTVVAVQPIATALSLSGGAAVTQNILLFGPPPPPAPVVRRH